MYNLFKDLSLEEIRKIDTIQIAKHLKKLDINSFKWNNEFNEWFINGKHPYDYLYENDITILNPKEMPNTIFNIIEILVH